MAGDDQLATRLLALRDRVEIPREEDGTAATLLALMPCEPAIGEVAVAVWADSAGAELVEIVRLADGERIDDAVALRESLTLLAMVETVEELASFDDLAALRAELLAFPGDAPVELGEEFHSARERARESIDALTALSPGDEPRLAQPQLLDALGGALRELERAWELLEQAAELWSDAYLAEHERGEQAVALVQALWRTLAIGRRGPLGRAVSAALHEGREAGVAMAAAVSSTTGT